MKKIIILFTFGMFLSSCSVLNEKSKSNFIFKEGKYQITLEVENNILEIEKENKILVKLKNIEKEKVIFSGYKLRQEYSEKNQSDEMILIATPVFDNDSTDKTYKLFVSFKEEKLYHHQFLIPTKLTQN